MKSDIMKDRPVIIDTSIWIDYFRETSKEVVVLVESFLDQDLVLLPKIVLAELLQGTKDKKEHALLNNHFRLIKQVTESHQTWENAGLLSFEIKKKGHFANLSDCYIATIAIENNAAVYSLDKHFKIISKQINLQMIS